MKFCRFEFKRAINIGYKNNFKHGLFQAGWHMFNNKMLTPWSDTTITQRFRTDDVLVKWRR